MRVYLDESGIHDGADICAIAGYFGDQLAWEEFEGEWRSTLKEFGVPEFHAKCFWARDKKGQRVSPYTELDDARASMFINRLLGTIKDCRIYPVGAAVVGNEWRSLSENERRYLTGAEIKNRKFGTSGAPSKSYFLPFLQAVQRVARYCRNNEKAHFFFGLDRTFSDYACSCYQDILRLGTGWSSSLGPIQFPRSIDVTPLQASDLLAYQIYKYAIKRLSHWDHTTESHPELESALTRLKDPDNDFKLFDKRSLNAALEQFRKQYPDLCS